MNSWIGTSLARSDVGMAMTYAFIGAVEAYNLNTCRKMSGLGDTTNLFAIDSFRLVGGADAPRTFVNHKNLFSPDCVLGVTSTSVAPKSERRRMILYIVRSDESAVIPARP